MSYNDNFGAPSFAEGEGSYLWPAISAVRVWTGVSVVTATFVPRSIQMLAHGDYTHLAYRAAFNRPLNVTRLPGSYIVTNIQVPRNTSYFINASVSNLNYTVVQA